MISIKYLADAVLRSLIGTRAFTSGALAIGTTKTKVNTAAAINYCINGVNYVVAATNDLFVHTNLTVQAANSTKYYLLTLNAAGAGTITQGTSSALPAVPAGGCPVGYLKIVTGAATFTPATTNHDAANVTTTYVNLSCLPLSLS